MTSAELRQYGRSKEKQDKVVRTDRAEYVGHHMGSRLVSSCQTR